MTTVTVLIPAYNAAKYIRQSVSSVLAQRGVGVECVVIDDGSTDDTGDILAHEFGGAVRVMRQANAGHVKARNNGSKTAAGEWLAFLDADDEWLPDKLARQLDVADERTHVVYTERENFGEGLRVPKRQSDAQRLWDGDVFEPLLTIGNFITVSSVIIRKDVYDRFDGFNEDLLVCEDWDLWLRYTAEGGHIGVCREPLTRYRWHPGAMTNNYDRMLHGRLKVLRRAFALPRGQQLPARIKRQAVARVWETSAWYLAQARPRHALGWYGRSALHWPFNPGVYRAMAKCCLGLG